MRVNPLGTKVPTPMTLVSSREKWIQYPVTKMAAITAFRPACQWRTGRKVYSEKVQGSGGSQNPFRLDVHRKFLSGRRAPSVPEPEGDQERQDPSEDESRD